MTRRILRRILLIILSPLTRPNNSWRNAPVADIAEAPNYRRDDPKIRAAAKRELEEALERINR